jgi:hypothetical protein
MERFIAAHEALPDTTSFVPYPCPTTQGQITQHLYLEGGKCQMQTTLSKNREGAWIVDLDQVWLHPGARSPGWLRKTLRHLRRRYRELSVQEEI